MRPLEALLLIIALITLVALAVPQLRHSRSRWAVAFLPAVAALIQLSAEGFRWQMVPAYIFVVLLAGMAGLRAGKLTVVALTALLAVAAALPLVVPVFGFPPPGGPHGIGTLTYHWVDKSRADFGDPSMPRELVVQLWYPAVPAVGAETDHYVQPDVSIATGSQTVQLPAFYLSHLSTVRTHAVVAAPPAETAEPKPVLIFSPGARGFRQHNTFEVEELVSHGYVVAAIDHPRAASQVLLPDGRRIDADNTLIDIPRFFSEPAFGEKIFNYLGEDVVFVTSQIIKLNQADPKGVFTGQLDITRIGMFGVSLGGLVAAEACRIDKRLKACLIQDVFVPGDVIEAGVTQPTMWLTRDAQSMRDEGWPEWEVALHQDSMLAAFNGASAEGYLVHIPGMFHLNYTDFPLTVAAPIARALGLIGPIDWRRGHEIINAYTLAFFDRHLRGRVATLLHPGNASFPEVRLRLPARPLLGGGTEKATVPDSVNL
jgi:predicted dienelactone hydrolase